MLAGDLAIRRRVLAIDVCVCVFVCVRVCARQFVAVACWPAACWDLRATVDIIRRPRHGRTWWLRGRSGAGSCEPRAPLPCAVRRTWYGASGADEFRSRSTYRTTLSGRERGDEVTEDVFLMCVRETFTATRGRGMQHRSVDSCDTPGWLLSGSESVRSIAQYFQWNMANGGCDL